MPLCTVVVCYKVMCVQLVASHALLSLCVLLYVAGKAV
jgi:hypothetical protein